MTAYASAVFALLAQFQILDLQRVNKSQTLRDGIQVRLSLWRKQRDNLPDLFLDAV